MKKIAVIIDTWYPFIGGGQISTYEISKRIASDSHRVDIITRNLGADGLKLPKYLKVVKLGGKTQAFNPVSKLIFVIRSVMYVGGNNYDLVHAQAFLPGISAWAINKLKGLPIVFTVHGTSIGTNLNNAVKTWLEKLILTKINYSREITVSRDFLKVKNVNMNIIYISNGVDVKEFEKLKNHVPAQPTLIFVGKLHPQKNLIKLISAIDIVRKKIPKILLLIVGDGPQKDELERQVKTLELNRNVIFKGALNGQKNRELLKSSNIFILPSVYEGQPLTILEAWAAKIPVIVTAVGDNKYLVKDGNTGFLIDDAQNVQKIATVIEKAIKNKNLSKMGQNGYNFVAKNFSWDKSARMTKNIYEQLLKSQN